MFVAMVYNYVLYNSNMKQVTLLTDRSRISDFFALRNPTPGCVVELLSPSVQLTPLFSFTMSKFLNHWTVWRTITLIPIAFSYWTRRPSTWFCIYAQLFTHLLPILI